VRTIPFVLLFQLLFCSGLVAQVYTNKVVGKKNEAYKDSLEVTSYPYALPIWGAKAVALGFDLPYSAGLSINYITQKSDLVIENLLVGFNYGPMYNLDEIIRFKEAEAQASAFNIRPDIWVLPFLNSYGILSKAKTSTSIDAGIFVPDSSNDWSEIASIKTKAKFDASTFGFGMTPTIGVGGGWFAMDMNVSWTDVNALDKPVFAFIFGPRFGKTIKFKKPQQNLALWVGGFRVKYASATSGSLPFNEVIPTDGLQDKVDNGIQKVGQGQMKVDEWWNSLSSLEQANPVNKAKYATANRTLEASGNLLVSIDGALNDENTATVQYSLEKRVKDMWNLVLGSQFQVNKILCFVQNTVFSAVARSF
jgi:hypothetical protein